jgi:two-component system response regulator GlrR
MHICLIDDQPIILQTLSSFLNNLGYHVSCYGSGEQLAELQASGSAPVADVVITDLQLPGLHGTELIRFVHKLFPGAPIVVISGHWRLAMSVQEALDNDIHAFIAKPFSLSDLEFLLLRLAKNQEQASR